MPQRCLATAIGSPGTLSGCPFSQEKGREAALERGGGRAHRGIPEVQRRRGTGTGLPGGSPENG